jgi:alcohol dehydrogenase class IV
MIEPFDYVGLPARVRFGAGRVSEAPKALREIGGTRALVLSTPGQRRMAEQISDGLAALSAGIFSRAAMHTPAEVTEAALSEYQALGADCLVAVGGGSTIGLAKAIAWRTDAPQLVIPTTYSGSEVTTVLGETSGGMKRTQRSPKVLPEAVIYDLELTLGLPARISATSGLNAMAHAVEALYARDRNPVVSLLADAGLKGLARSLPAIVRGPRDREARGEAQYAGWLCGMCLATTSMALHHKICHVLGGTFGLPHAETHAILLPHSAAYNAPAAPDAMRRVAAALPADDAPTGLYGLARSLGVPLALKDIGMTAEGLDRATELALADPYWNPRPLEAGPIRALISRAFEGAPPQSG